MTSQDSPLRKSRMERWSLLAAVAATAAVLGATILVLVGGSGAPAPAHAEHEGAVLEPFARGTFTDEVVAQFRQRLQGTSQTRVVNVDGASDIIVVKLTVPPHGAVPWHTHPGPALVAVAEGTLTITYAGECIGRDYSQGQAFLDSGQLTHRADNHDNDDDAVVYVTFIGIPAGSAPTIPAPEGFDSGCD